MNLSSSSTPVLQDNETAASTKPVESFPSGSVPEAEKLLQTQQSSFRQRINAVLGQVPRYWRESTGILTIALALTLLSQWSKDNVAKDSVPPPKGPVEGSFKERFIPPPPWSPGGPFVDDSGVPLPSRAIPGLMPPATDNLTQSGYGGSLAAPLRGGASKSDPPLRLPFRPPPLP